MQWVFWMIRRNRYSFSLLRGSSPAEPCWHRLILLCRRHLSLAGRLNFWSSSHDVQNWYFTLHNGGRPADRYCTGILTDARAEALVVLEYPGFSDDGSGMGSSDNPFVRNPNHKAVHKIGQDETLSEILSPVLW